MRDASKAEFDAFIAGYPRPLSRQVVGFCEPPKLMFHDETLPGDALDQMVASYSLPMGGPKGTIYDRPEGDWRIQD
jgi:hypothetical protein